MHGAGAGDARGGACHRTRHLSAIADRRRRRRCPGRRSDGAIHRRRPPHRRRALRPRGRPPPRSGSRRPRRRSRRPGSRRRTVDAHRCSQRVLLQRTPAVIGSGARRDRLAIELAPAAGRRVGAGRASDARLAGRDDRRAAARAARLRSRPSNSAFTNYGQLRVSFGGTGNDRGAVLVDGLPAQDAFGGQVDWTAYPAEKITRAELLRGAGSALYGSGAIGGVLALQARAPGSGERDPADGFASIAGGGLARSDGACSSGRRSVTGSRRRCGRRRRARRIDHRAGDEALARSIAPRGAGAKRRSCACARPAARGRWRRRRLRDRCAGPRPSELRLRPHPRAGPAALRPRRFAHETRLTGTRARPACSTSPISFPPSPACCATCSTCRAGRTACSPAGPPRTEPRARRARRPARGARDQRPARRRRLAAEPGQRQPNADGLRRAGDRDVGRFEALAGARYDRVAFSEGRLVDVTGKVTTITDAPARDDAAVSPRLALRYDVSPAVALRASSGAGFRAPYLNELVRGFQVGAVRMAPNPALVPERARTEARGSTCWAAVLGSPSTSPARTSTTRSGSKRSPRRCSAARTSRARAPTARSRRTPRRRTLYARAAERSNAVRARPRRPARDHREAAAVRPRPPATAAIDTQAGPVRYGIDARFVGTAYADESTRSC